MKNLLTLLLSLALGVSLTADPASHRQAADELVTAVAGPEIVKAGFNASLQPMFESLRQRGAPPEMITEFQAALEDWFNTEIKWAELQPLIADLYVQEYTENELTTIVAFIKTPVGQKMMKSTPALMQKGMVIGQQYAMTKQATLEKRLEEITTRYQAKAAEAAAAAAPAAPVPAVPAK